MAYGKHIGTIVPERVYHVLNKERGNFTMSSFVMNILAMYVDVIEDEKLQNGNSNIIPEVLQ